MVNSLPLNIDLMLTQQAVESWEHYELINPDNDLHHYLATYCREEPLLEKFKEDNDRYILPALIEAGQRYYTEVMHMEEV